MDMRQENIEAAAKKTFEWIFTHPKVKFVDWLQSNEIIYWIAGKPGCGKSTAMKFLVKHPRVQEILDANSDGGRWVIASFFFTFQGTKLERTLEGFLRSFLIQIFRSLPSLADLVIKPLGMKESDLASGSQWTLPQLQHRPSKSVYLWTHSMNSMIR
jgi:hypothetical protein